MAWVAQKELDEAIDIMQRLCTTLTTHRSPKLKVKHPAQNLSRDRWAQIICGAIASQDDQVDVVLPEYTYIIQEEDNAAKAPTRE